MNTVVLVRDDLGGGDLAVAIALGAFGTGSMAAALALPKLLDRLDDRVVMTRSAGALVVLLVAGAVLFSATDGSSRWVVLLGLWAALGVAYSAVLTPVGRLIRASAAPCDLPALFAAQYALSHAEWLVLYLLAGFLGTALHPAAALACLAAVALAGLVYARRAWTAESEVEPVEERVGVSL
ncbi:MFS transporter [Actinokineospora soli]|uniref:MFS transporter n=1 Tax=Actinokineospora soli TaxID=1048753 RepID=A0ABW2TMD8_9PSEU